MPSLWVSLLPGLEGVSSHSGEERETLHLSFGASTSEVSVLQVMDQGKRTEKKNDLGWRADQALDLH